jgi:hypothetical protein
MKQAHCDLEALRAEPNQEPKSAYYPAYDGYCAPRARRRFGLPGRCDGTWVGASSLGWRPDDLRIRRKVTGRTKTEVRENTDLMFTTSVGTPLDASHVRRDFGALRKGH